MVDTYRGHVDPAPLLDVAVYLSFFSHLVAGPIVRASEFLPQIDKPRDPANVAVGAGLFLIAVGLIKKVAVADYLAREVVDPVFAVPEAHAAPDVIFAAYAYAAQIYCDFSGYTDMAIGLALLLGIVFPQNFNRPVPLAKLRRVLAAVAHDAVALPARLPLHPARREPGRPPVHSPQPDDHDAAGRALARRGVGLRALGRNPRHARSWSSTSSAAARPRSRSWLKWFITFHIVVLAWIVFRAPDLSVAGELFSQLTDWGDATRDHLDDRRRWSLGTIGLQLLPERETGELRLRVEQLHPAAMGAALAVVVMFVAATVPTQGVPPFIYFAF